MKIKDVLFPSVFFKITDPCVALEVIFNVFTRSDFRNQQNWILKNGSCERTFKWQIMNVLGSVHTIQFWSNYHFKFFCV